MFGALFPNDCVFPHRPFCHSFLLAGFLSETARKQSWENRIPYNVFENMYRFGSIVFGGADVLIPVMYNQYVVRPTTERIKRTNKDVISVDRDVFLSASGVVRAIPGPAFSISAFIGGMAMSNRGWGYQLLGCFLAATAIFLPSFLLVIFSILSGKTSNNTAAFKTSCLVSTLLLLAS